LLGCIVCAAALLSLLDLHPNLAPTSQSERYPSVPFFCDLFPQTCFFPVFVRQVPPGAGLSAGSDSPLVEWQGADGCDCWGAHVDAASVTRCHIPRGTLRAVFSERHIGRMGVQRHVGSRRASMDGLTASQAGGCFANLPPF
jgi:hypothetical protein